MLKVLGGKKVTLKFTGGAEYVVDFVPKIKLEVAVPDEKLDLALDSISKVARTGKIGDGKIFVMELAGSTRIRTGESGDSVL